MDWLISPEPVAYPDALSFMTERTTQIRDGNAPDTVWLLEHPPLYTAGTSARTSDLLDPDRFDVFETGRGGQFTYHGPGQRVVYVMMDLRKRGRDVRAFVRTLEDWVIRTLARFGILGERRVGRVGIWVVCPDGTERKIAAIGVRVSGWITSHGISINVTPDLNHFGGIVPCGLSDFGVTSLEALDVPAEMNDIDAALKDTFNAAFQLD